MLGNLERVSGLSLVDLRSQVEEQGLETAYRQGRSLQFGAIIALATSLLEDFSRTLSNLTTAAQEQASRSPLSRREMEVLQWVAEGLTSKQIGQQLFISPKTVNHHLTSVFNKLGVDSRAQAVAVAARQGFL
jgi:NarL family two-component system response regulator YdfI